jgi:hypothetical protein
MRSFPIFMMKTSKQSINHVGKQVRLGWACKKMISLSQVNCEIINKFGNSGLLYNGKHSRLLLLIRDWCRLSRCARNMTLSHWMVQTYGPDRKRSGVLYFSGIFTLYPYLKGRNRLCGKYVLILYPSISFVATIW